MAAPEIPAGVERLPHYDQRSESDYVLAVLRHIASIQPGGRDNPPDWRKWGVESAARAREREADARLYADVLQGGEAGMSAPVQIGNADTGAVVLTATAPDDPALPDEVFRVAGALADEWGAPMQAQMWNGERWVSIGRPVAPLAQARLWL